MDNSLAFSFVCHAFIESTECSTHKKFQGERRGLVCVLCLKNFLKREIRESWIAVQKSQVCRSTLRGVESFWFSILVRARSDISKQERARIPLEKNTFDGFLLINTYLSNPPIPGIEKLNSCPLSNSRDGNRLGMPSPIDMFEDSRFGMNGNKNFKY